MQKLSLRLIVFALSILALLTLSPNERVRCEGQEKLPPARKIPGLTTEDQFPQGCVDCHINMPEINKDERIGTLMSRWNKAVDSKLLEKAKSAAPAGIFLKGVHPKVPAAFRNIPDGCKPCHGKTSRIGPPLAPLLHLIHLSGGADNHFLTIFQGECTHCHKMDRKTGRWSMPSGPEK